MVSKVTSFKLNVDLVKQLKIQAIKEDKTATELLEQYITAGLKNNNEDNIEIQNRFKNATLNDLIGIGETEEVTNAVKLDRELYQ